MSRLTRGHSPGGRWVLAYAVVPLTAAGAASVLAFVDPFRVTLWPVRPVGTLLTAAGVALGAWTAATFRRMGETLSPVADPRQLVTAGPLAYTRNPLYLAVVTACLGIAGLAGSPVALGYAAALWLAYHVVVVTVEEPKLREAFGGAFDRYCERVPRWLPHPR
ncbi:MAG: isoprenylcysteine carboxylmethyltransferase family protein [Halovenus sp.]